MSDTLDEHRQPPEIDWQSIWKQLDWDDAERQQQTLKERLQQRAEQYAEPLVESDMGEETYTMLTFDLGAERYGIDVMVVRGVRTVGAMTRVPGAPAFYRGVVNVRGQILSVLDLRRFFDLDVDPHRKLEEMIIVRGDGLEIGLLAEHIAEVITIPRRTIEPVDIHYARGVTSDKLVVLDIEQMLVDERLRVGGDET